MKFVTWNDYTTLLTRLSEEIRSYTFDDVVAIGRGGSIMAAYFASKLGIPTFTPLFVAHVGRGATAEIVARDTNRAESLRGRLLVVDDSLINGKAMKYVLDLISKGASVTSLVMYVRKGADFTPDFVGEYLDEKEHDVVFPYDLP